MSSNLPEQSEQQLVIFLYFIRFISLLLLDINLMMWYPKIGILKIFLIFNRQILNKLFMYWYYWIPITWKLTIRNQIVTLHCLLPKILWFEILLVVILENSCYITGNFDYLLWNWLICCHQILNPENLSFYTKIISLRCVFRKYCDLIFCWRTFWKIASPEKVPLYRLFHVRRPQIANQS